MSSSRLFLLCASAMVFALGLLGYLIQPSSASFNGQSQNPGNTLGNAARFQSEVLGSWQTGLTHTAEAGANRALVVVAGNEHIGNVELLGAWQTGLSHVAEAGSDRTLVFVGGHENGTPITVQQIGSWGTGLSHVAPAGSDRMLVFVAGYEHSTGAAITMSSVTYGGQSLSPVNAISVGATGKVRVEIWVLDEAGIAAASGTSFVPTWSLTPDYAMYSHVFYSDVDQSAPGGAISSSDAATPNPITTAALATLNGGMVVTGAVAGNDGSYTPQNGFAAGNDQTAGTTVTMGTAYKATTGVNETPSMQHSNPNRQVIAAVVLNPSTNYPPAPTLSSVTFGGQVMSKVNDVSVGATTTVHVEIWLLDEAGIAAASGSTFLPTWSVTPDNQMYSHAFFGGVDQVSTIGSQQTASTASSTPNPITTAALADDSGDIVVTGAVAGESGSYTPQNGWTLGNDQTAGATTTLGTAYKSGDGTGEVPSMLHSGPDQQVIAAVELNAQSGTIATLTSLTYGGQALTKVNDATAGTTFTAHVEIWVLDEAGIAAASGSTLVPTWSVTPNLPMYTHAFFDEIDQTTPIGDQDTASTNASTPNPITTAALSTTHGDMVVVGAVSGNSGSYTPQNGFNLGNEQTAASTTTLASAFKGSTGTTETPSMLHSGPNRQAIAAIVLNH